jgi:hypothetical protein
MDVWVPELKIRRISRPVEWLRVPQVTPAASRYFGNPFISYVFIDAVRSWDYVASNGRMNNEFTGMDEERIGPRLI